jgi:hypothetical protein
MRENHKHEIQTDSEKPDQHPDDDVHLRNPF